MSRDHSVPGGGTAVGPYASPTYGPAYGVPTDVFVRAGVTGALVGATAEVAVAWPRLKDHDTRQGAARDVAVSAGKTGVATGLGAMVAASLRGGPVVSAVAMVATGAAALYLMNKAGKAKGAAPAPAPTSTNEGETA